MHFRKRASNRNLMQTHMVNKLTLWPLSVKDIRFFVCLTLNYINTREISMWVRKIICEIYKNINLHYSITMTRIYSGQTRHTLRRNTTCEEDVIEPICMVNIAKRCNNSYSVSALSDVLPSHSTRFTPLPPLPHKFPNTRWPQSVLLFLPLVTSHLIRQMGDLEGNLCGKRSHF